MINNLVISAYAASNVGKRRLNNEDNYYINHSNVNSLNDTNASVYNVDSFVGSVCDGMGGEAAGEVASQIAVETVEKFEKQLIYENCSDSIIEKTIAFANNAICDEISKCKKRMGTTLTLLGFNNDKITISNIGDSRIYRYSGNAFEQLSHDHTEAQTMVDAGMVSQEQSMKLKEKHRLTQHLGIFPYEMIIEPYTVRCDAKVGDRYLLCSDGLTDMLNESEIKALFDKGYSIEKTVDLLISSALEKGGKDNVTVLLCEISKNENANYTKNEINSKDAIIAAFGIEKMPNDKPIKIDKDVSMISNYKKPKKSNKIIYIILFICVLIFVFVIAFATGYKFSNKTVDKNSTETTVSEKVKTQTASVIFENMF